MPNACPMEDNRTGQLRARAFEDMVASPWPTTPRLKRTATATRSAFHPCAFDDEGGRDTLVVRAGPDAGVVPAGFDLDELRAWRRTEVWGGASRRPRRYERLVSDAIAEPFTVPTRRAPFEKKLINHSARPSCP